MRRVYTGFILVILCAGVVFHAGGLAGLLDYPDAGGVLDQSFGQVRHFGLQDGVSDCEEFYGVTVPLEYEPQEVHTSDDAGYEYMAVSPYYQYFQNLKEYVNPANGYLTVTQTDLVIPGRGLDLVISRVYQTPAVFYGVNPYDYESPPVDVGKGWQLNFPYVGDKYLHLWGGTIYKIAWVENTFENHEGSHFTLVKNGDDTYTLTTASGTVYEFDTSGKLTQIKDVDLNTITFTYTSGVLTSVTDTIGRTVSFTYSSNRLQKITYNSAELEYSYDANGCLQWMDDFLNRRTSYYYNTGYNNWLLSKIEYATAGYTTYHQMIPTRKSIPPVVLEQDA